MTRTTIKLGTRVDKIQTMKDKVDVVEEILMNDDDDDGKEKSSGKEKGGP